MPKAGISLDGRRPRKETLMKKVEDYVRTIPDFPEEGIMFRDITTVLQAGTQLKRL